MLTSWQLEQALLAQSVALSEAATAIRAAKTVDQSLHTFEASVGYICAYAGHLMVRGSVRYVCALVVQVTSCATHCTDSR